MSILPDRAIRAVLNARGQGWRLFMAIRQALASGLPYSREASAWSIIIYKVYNEHMFGARTDDASYDTTRELRGFGMTIVFVKPDKSIYMVPAEPSMVYDQDALNFHLAFPACLP